MLLLQGVPRCNSGGIREERGTSWEDGVMGRIEIPNKDINDFVIMRADG